MADWETSISSAGRTSEIRGVDLETVMNMPFHKAIYLTLKGEEPSEKEAELFTTILSGCVDHGIGNPSTISARTVQSGGNGMNTSVAAGIMALGNKHGGAIEEAMRLLQSDSSAEEIVRHILENNKKIPGLGHKVYISKDPRTEEILNKAERLGLKGKNIEKMLRIQKVFADRKTNLVLNVDGAIAGVMSDMGFEPELGKGFFIIARTPGLVAHVREEMDEPDFRRLEGEYKED